MNKKRLTAMVAGTALAALSLACGDTGTTTTTNTATTATTTTTNTAASNTAVVVNNNGNKNTAGVSTTRNYNANITRAEYDKDKESWTKEAKDAGGTIGQGAEDGWLWTKTRASLMTTDDLRESTINVDVNNDVVTLRGTVASAAQKTKAETVAKAIKGVKSVKNDLKVQPNDSITNTNGNRNANVNANANGNRKS